MSNRSIKTNLYNKKLMKQSFCHVMNLAYSKYISETKYTAMLLVIEEALDKYSFLSQGSDNEGGPSRNLPPLAYENCVTYFDLEVQWNVDADHNEIDFRVCNCDTSLS